ncbi:hypothetical protein [Nonomuraea diastatica]|uniref:Uncharacterized protein n=1 Tax=Nonomuraea diastatica TaxID=1848329 RepID=A0A4R4W473_9ACTN|nr:hypothetical protein [Nonomuraea diastatica]TDD13358.1 hypothetical protein E1294_41290 [Nonomuraea diastatica]
MGHPRWVLHPIVIGPDGIPSIIDLGWAVDQPELATVSAIVHGQSEAGLSNILPLPDEARARILARTDLHVLESWVRKAATAKSADELFL